ncbi:ATP-binding protein [Hahella sp. CR1]|uniref:sensor histidine kinase n=1 Tax=Hahella sp. CR1 TaxID=2992807 RepID=UPI002441D492|nr:ATP-binding protein [Hahella sp. CR1]MDG9670934.1 ATP-binding protein [Hahella sp. CR1]
MDILLKAGYFRRLRLTRRLMVAIAGALLLFYGGFAFYTLSSLKEQVYEDFYARADYLMEIAVQANAQNMWDFDLSKSNQFAKSLSKDPIVSAVIFEVYDAVQNGGSFFTGNIGGIEEVRQRSPSLDVLEPERSRYVFRQEREVVWENSVIGRAYLYFSDSPVQAKLEEQTASFVLALLGFLFLYLLALFYIFSHWFSRPFLGMHQLAVNLGGSLDKYRCEMEQGDHNENALPDLGKLLQQSGVDTHREDEMGDFIRAFAQVMQAFTVVASELSQRSQHVSKLNEELENRIQERTWELKRANASLQESLESLQVTQSQMVQQEKLASLGQLAAGVAHEINNPIGYVASNINRLKEYYSDFEKLFQVVEAHYDRVPIEVAAELDRVKDEIDYDFLKEDLPELLQDCLEGSRRVQEIVENLKNYSRVDQGDVHLDFNINDVITSTLKLVWNELKYDCDVETDLQNTELTCGNQGQINQVVSNILVNASHAIKETQRHGKVRIRTHSDSEWVYAEVSDTGCGIPQDIVCKIFDPFFTTKPVGKGTGLGLNISYDIIVNKHRGDIKVESRTGVGSTFIIKLPIAQRKAQPERPSSAA